MATAGVLLFKGPQARRYTQKVVHTQGGLWPPQESCYLKEFAGAGPRVERSEPSVERSELKLGGGGRGGEVGGGGGGGGRGGVGGGGWGG